MTIYVRKSFNSIIYYDVINVIINCTIEFCFLENGVLFFTFFNYLLLLIVFKKSRSIFHNVNNKFSNNKYIVNIEAYFNINSKLFDYSV